MQLFNFVSIKLTLCLSIGIVIGFNIEVGWQVPVYCILTLLPLLFWAKRKQTRNGFPYFELIFVFATSLLGIFIVTLAQSKSFPTHYSKKNFTEQKLWHLKIRDVLKPNPFTQRYVAYVISLENEQSSGNLILSFPIDSTAIKLKVDDELVIFSKAETISPPLNPHQFNYKDYLKKLGIYHQIRVNSKDYVFKESTSSTIYGLASNFRERIISKLKNKDFGEDELAVIQALLLGQRSDISESTYTNYKNAGAVHILAVSGLHVGILLLLLQFLLNPIERFPKGKSIKLMLIVLLLWAYAFIAGLSPSIVRAVTMFTFLAYAMYLNKPTNAFNSIALSMFFILLIKPLFLFQVGFQMSYAAVFAIVWIYPKLQQFWFPENYLIQKIWQLFSVSVAAQLGVLPISLFYFHQFPALFFVSNLLIIPFLGFILGMGVLIILLSIFNSLPNVMVQVYNQVIKSMNAIVDWIAQQEGFIIKDIPFDNVQMVLAYLIIIALIVFLSKPRFKNAIALLLGIVALQGWTIWTQVKVQNKEAFILLHKSKNTILLHQTGKILTTYTDDTVTIKNAINDYKIAERIKSITVHELKNSYDSNGKSIYVMDSISVYPKMLSQDFLLLTQSPKVNLERVIDSIEPKIVIADGSNYPSYIERWKQTCLQKEIPFHSTSEKGYYVFKFNGN